MGLSTRDDRPGRCQPVRPDRIVDDVIGSSLGSCSSDTAADRARRRAGAALLVVPGPFEKLPARQPAERPHPDRVVDDPGQHHLSRTVAREHPDQDRDEAEGNERPDDEFH